MRGGGKEADGLGAWLALLQAHSVVSEGLEKAVQAAAGLSLSQFEVLIFLADTSDGRLPMNDVAKALLLSKSGVTRLVDKLVEAGLVARTACATDRRITYAALTPEGRDRLRRAVPAHSRALAEVFSGGLTVAELRQMRAMLGKILAWNDATAVRCPSAALAEPAALV